MGASSLTTKDIVTIDDSKIVEGDGMKRQRRTMFALAMPLLVGLLCLSVPTTLLAQQFGKNSMEATVQSGTAPEQLVNLVRQYYQTIEAQPFDEARVAPFFAENYSNYPPRKVPSGVSAKAATLNLLKNLSRGFPDARRTLIMVEPLGRDRVLAYFSFSGTHTGDFFSYAPTGNKVSFIGVDIFKISDGKFVENHHVEDLTTLFEQMNAKSAAVD